MQRKVEETLGSVLRQALEENMMASQIDQLKAVNMWKAMMGPYITEQCRSVTVADGRITVKLDSAPMRQELSMRRSEMTALINGKFGRQVIKEIRFI